MILREKGSMENAYLKKAILVVIITLVLPGWIYGEQLKVGITDFRPLYVVEGTQYSGSLYSILLKILNRAEYKYQVIGYPPKKETPASIPP